MVRPSLKLDLGASYDILIGRREFDLHGAFISNDNLLIFSEIMMQQIREEMYRWVNHPNRPDKVVDYNIVRFQEHYGFSEDSLPFDNLKRWYYRERKRIEKRNEKTEKFKPQLSFAL